MKRITFTKDQTVQVFRLGTTTNKKIADAKEKIVQTYTFSKDQFDYIANCLAKEEKPVFKTFFSLDAKNCFDCPFSMNSGGGGCYTHKVMQYSGFVSMLKSIVKEFGSYDAIPEFSNMINLDLGVMAKDRYVRFGTYGEPSMHPISTVGLMTKMAKNWTGYTHQWFKKPEFSKWFMASVHNAVQEQRAKETFGFRSFVATDNDDVSGMVHCPASKEMGFKSNCSKCGLCSGSTGKGNKSVLILEH